MLIIDRFEEDMAVIEDTEAENHFEVKRELIADDVSEDDVVSLINGIYEAEKDETKKRKADVLALLKKIGLE